MQLSTETGLVLNGSYIVFSCINGYVNMGGSLNVTCSASGTWSPFPNCVSSSGSVFMTATAMVAGNNQMTTTTMAAGNNQMTTTIMSGGSGSPCIVDTTTTFNITNGYPRTMSLLYTTNTTATGN
jgi:hypothetical protein